MTYAQSAMDHMIESQLLTGDVPDQQILAAVSSVDRSRFVPEQYKLTAFVDGEIPLGDGRALIEPLTFARMLKLAVIGPRDSVLDVACGSGYGTAVVSRLCAKAIGLESSERLAPLAAKNIVGLGISNATIVHAPIADGYHPAGPYDVILIEGEAEVIPQALRDQLCEGGRLVVVEKPRGTAGRMGRLVRYLKTSGTLNRWDAYDAAASAVAEFRAPQHFSF